MKGYCVTQHIFRVCGTYLTVPLSPEYRDGCKEDVRVQEMPNYAHLRVFGCEAYAHVPKELRQKLDPKSQKCIFIGYGTEGEMGYCLRNPESHKVMRSLHVIFNESEMHKKPIKEIEFRKVTFETFPLKLRSLS